MKNIAQLVEIELPGFATLGWPPDSKDSQWVRSEVVKAIRSGEVGQILTDHARLGKRLMRRYYDGVRDMGVKHA